MTDIKFLYRPDQIKWNRLNITCDF